MLRQGLARLYLEGEYLKLLSDRAVSGLLHGREAGPETSLAKLVWSECETHIAEMAGQLLGPAANTGAWGRDRVYARALSIAGGFVGRPLRRLAESQLVVDESWAISIAGGRFDRRLLLGAGLAIYAAWVGGTALGVVGGGIVGDPARFGLDAAFPALFLALLAPRLRDRTALLAALIGGGLAAVLIPVARPGVPIVVASLGCLVGLRR